MTRPQPRATAAPLITPSCTTCNTLKVSRVPPTTHASTSTSASLASSLQRLSRPRKEQQRKQRYFRWRIYVMASCAALMIASLQRKWFQSLEESYKQETNLSKVRQQEKIPPKTIQNSSFSTLVSSCEKANPCTQAIRLNKNISLPILVVGLAKAGTTSLSDFFTCGGYQTSHWLCANNTGLCGVCMQKAIQQQRPPLTSCGLSSTQVFAQMDVTAHPKHCFWPQISALEEIHKDQPNATFVLNMRNLEDWIASVKAWKVRHAYRYKRFVPLTKQLVACGLMEDFLGNDTSNRRNQNRSPAGVAPNASNRSSLDQVLRQFYCNHVERIRTFVKHHPSHTLIEVDINDPDVGDYLGSLFHVSPNCWGMHNVNVLSQSKNLTALAEAKNLSVITREEVEQAFRDEEKHKNAN